MIELGAKLWGIIRPDGRIGRVITMVSAAAAGQLLRSDPPSRGHHLYAFVPRHQLIAYLLRSIDRRRRTFRQGPCLPRTDLPVLHNQESHAHTSAHRFTPTRLHIVFSSGLHVRLKGARNIKRVTLRILPPGNKRRAREGPQPVLHGSRKRSRSRTNRDDSELLRAIVGCRVPPP